MYSKFKTKEMISSYRMEYFIEFMPWKAIETNTESEFENGMDHFMTVNIKFAAL